MCTRNTQCLITKFCEATLHCAIDTFAEFQITIKVGFKTLQYIYYLRLLCADRAGFALVESGQLSEDILYIYGN